MDRTTLPAMSEIVSVWLGRDDNDNPSAMLFGKDQSRHLCVRDRDGSWHAIELSIPDDTEEDGAAEFLLTDRPKLAVDPVEIGRKLIERPAGEGFGSGDPGMN